MKEWLCRAFKIKKKEKDSLKLQFEWAGFVLVRGLMGDIRRIP